MKVFALTYRYYDSDGCEHRSFPEAIFRYRKEAEAVLEDLNEEEEDVEKQWEIEPIDFQ